MPTTNKPLPPNCDGKNITTCIGSVVVTYNPEEESLRILLEALSSQVCSIVIVDNNSLIVPSAPDFTRYGYKNLEVINLKENLGIAAAQNLGISRLIQKDNPQYILLLDQDSVPDTDMVRNLLVAHRNLEQKGLRVACVGPTTIDSRTKKSGKFIHFKNWSIKQTPCGLSHEEKEVDFLISSGSLIYLKALKDIGMMNEGFFIDHVDTEWCLRARLQGWKLYGICDALLAHTMGDKLVEIRFKTVRQVALHHPSRDYYKIRNTILMIKNLEIPLKWKLALLIRGSSLSILYIILGPQRLLTSKLVLKGVRDGLACKSGMLEGKSKQ